TTAGARALVLYGVNAVGTQLAWKNPGGAWQTATTGAVTNGLLWPSGQDHLASIALARDPAGAEHAWVVWSAATPSSLKPVQMRRLSNLDAPGGPAVGPLVTVDAPARGAYKPDVGFERQSDGSTRGAIVWTRRTGDTSYEIAADWFTDLSSDAPALQSGGVVLSTTSRDRFGSVVPSPQGLRLAARGGAGNLRVYVHALGAALTSWTQSVSGRYIDSSEASPTGVALDSGDILATVEAASTAHTVVVNRFSPTGSAVTTDLTLTGYTQPSLAGDGQRAWLVMRRVSDGAVVSRQFTSAGGWTTTDRLGLRPGGGGQYDR